MKLGIGDDRPISALKYIFIKVDKTLWHKGSSDLQKFHSIIKLHKNLCK